MKRLSSAEVVKIWEVGNGRTPMARAAALVVAASPELAWADVGALTLGEWERRLLSVRRTLIGPTLEAWVTCPNCMERLEFALEAARLMDAHGEVPAGTRELSLDRVELRFRAITAEDLAQAAQCRDAAAARRQLAQACVLDAVLDGEAVTAQELPDAAVAALSAALAEADPGAEAVVDLTCAACGHRWSTVLDLGRFVWTELSAQAERLLGEVDLLARTYGWSEGEVLGLGAERRRRYLEMAL